MVNSTLSPIFKSLKFSASLPWKKICKHQKINVGIEKLSSTTSSFRVHTSLTTSALSINPKFSFMAHIVPCIGLGNALMFLARRFPSLKKMKQRSFRLLLTNGTSPKTITFYQWLSEKCTCRQHLTHHHH